MRAIAVYLSVLVAVISGCRDSSQDDDIIGTIACEPDTMVITSVDTLGNELGGTPDVFAMIVEAAYTQEGNVAVLDAGKITLQVFSADGAELLAIGRKGSGPGEYQLPLGLAVTDYGFVLSDISGGKLLRYDNYGEFIDEITGFFPIPPVRIKGAGDRFLATDIFMDVSEGELPSISMDFVAFSEGSDPVLVYESYPMDMNSGMVNSDEAPSFAFAAGPDGEAYIALLSDSMFQLSGYGPQGEHLLAIEEEWDRIPLSQEELEEEEMSISLSIENGESTLGTSRNRRTDTHRNIIEDIGVDCSGNVWVQMGDTGETYFRIYSPDGILLHIAVPDATIAEDANYSISPHGLLAYDSDPQDWPKVYLLQGGGQ